MSSNDNFMNMLHKQCGLDKEKIKLQDPPALNEYTLVKFVKKEEYEAENEQEKEWNKITRSIIWEASEKYDNVLTVLRLFGGVCCFGGVIGIICSIHPAFENPPNFSTMLTFTVISFLVTLVFELLPSSRLIKDLLIFKLKCKNYWDQEDAYKHRGE